MRVEQRKRRGCRPARLACLVACLLALSIVGTGLTNFRPAVAAGSEDPDWPCIQRKVSEISPAQVWNGPPLDSVGDSWRDDDALASLARILASRRTEMAAAASLIADFAAKAETDRNRRLVMLFAGVLATINQERSSILAGIGRYARRQKALAQKIEAQTTELDGLPESGTADQNARRNELEEMQTWDTRIFQERERSLKYVCELPVTLEQRAFAIGKEIAAHLEK
jgi:hypothetical protein